MNSKRNPIAKSLRSPHLRQQIMPDKKQREQERQVLRERLGLSDGECFDCDFGPCHMNCGPCVPS